MHVLVVDVGGTHVNDAAMQALGSYQGGKMLFLGLGTSLGSTMIVDGIMEPMELGHLPYKRRTFEDYVGVRGYDGTGSVSCNSVFVLHLGRFLDQEELMEREAMVQNP
jgi:hypothetical protein